ncbi:MAG TPA: SigB/SigF/SigG family RNA polymerase sigma factor [Nocardioidaceae bacterium]|nr:SigB/SigF/SigG family RNA polymerase sigma factor [Nocardioidaceae bacterium]
MSGTVVAEQFTRSERNQETIDLLADAADASPEQRRSLLEQVVRLNMPLARTLANRYAGRGITTDDLRQVAYLGLVKAVRGYDASRGREFLGYAIPTIKGEIRRHFRDAGWAVRPPRRIQELQARLWAADAELTQTLHRSPTAAEIAEELGVSIDDVLESLSADGCFAPSSLDAPTGDSETGSLSDRLGGEDVEFDRAEARLILAKAVRDLSERDRTIVRLRFFEGRTQQQIGAEVGVTQMQISRLLNRILGDLRESITGRAA